MPKKSPAPEKCRIARVRNLSQHSVGSLRKLENVQNGTIKFKRILKLKTSFRIQQGMNNEQPCSTVAKSDQRYLAGNLGASISFIFFRLLFTAIVLHCGDLSTKTLCNSVTGRYAWENPQKRSTFQLSIRKMRHTKLRIPCGRFSAEECLSFIGINEYR